MPYIAHRKIKGRTYRYLTESHRENGSPRQRTLKYLGAAPTLEKNAPIAVIMFAGGGGVECGLIEAGIRPVISVECDPTNPDLSRELAHNNHLNFKPYGGKVLFQTVEDLAKNSFAGIPLNPDYLVACPVCSNFSQAKGGTEQQRDLDAAIAVAQAISHIKPVTFLLENVPAYEKSDSWHLIYAALKGEGYQVVAAALDAADYGVPQSRSRFIVKAGREDKPGLPPKQKRIGWFEAIADLIPDLPPSELLPAQRAVLDEKLALKPGLEALLIERIGYREKPQTREPVEPAWVIKKSVFHDGKGANRNRFIDVWLVDGTVKALTIEAAARIQGFPQWYHLPLQVSVAGSILGYSVPPPLVKALVEN
ncbi:MAG TPA: DNA cytosine methyltransferase [Oculatellaceae cyanobacterium]